MGPVTTYMAHTLTEADQTQRRLSGEAAHDEVCSWLGFHSGPMLTDGIPALDGMYLHLAGVLRAELPQFACSTPGAAFVVEGWERENDATRQLYAPGTGLLPQALRATEVGSVDHRNLTLVEAFAADLGQLQRYGLDPAHPETFDGLFTQVRYGPPTPGGQRRMPDGLVGRLAFRQDGPSALVTFECWAGEPAEVPASRAVRADLLSIMLPSAGSSYSAATVTPGSPG